MEILEYNENMKTKFKLLFVAVALVTLLFTSCLSTVSEFIGKPEIKFDNVKLTGLDMDGFTFNVGYTVKNPYPVSFSIAGIDLNVVNDNDSSVITNMNCSEGVQVLGMDSAKNTASFFIPYKTVLSLASKVSKSESLESLPFSVKGNAKLDLSSVPLFEGESLTLPFNKSFNVPVFKPSFSVSAPTIQMPGPDDFKKALVDGGMNAVKAAKLVANIIAGNKLTSDVFDGIDLDLSFKFNLNVKNEGSCSWNYLMDKCVVTSGDNRLAGISPDKGNTISSKSGTIPVTLSLNTVQSGRYIVELLNKTAKNPVVTIDSVLNFPEISGFMSDIPLDYKKEISVSSITKKN